MRIQTVVPSGRKPVPLVAVLLVIAVFTVRGAAQQTTGSISGTINDPSGAVLPDVTVTAINASTSTTLKTVSEANGLYTFPTLPPGTYTITAEKNGFNQTTIPGIVLQVYQKVLLDVALRVGSQSETVTVEGRAPLVDATTASLGTELEEKSIQDLPLNLRQVSALALTVPGTVDSSSRSLTAMLGNGSGFNDSSFSGAGGYSGSNVLLIDGMISRSLNNGSFALNPPPDMVKEFKVQSNVYDAGFGSTSAVVMNLVTQSGSNAYHGAGWEYLRNRDLDARQTFQGPDVVPIIPQYIRNQFGASFGGAIIKSKLFGFVAYEGLRQLRGATSQSHVPTATQKAGDFSGLLTGQTQNLCGPGGPANLNYDTGQLFDPATESFFTCPNGGGQVLVGTAISGNIITSIDPVAQKILPLFSDQNGVDASGRAVYVNPVSSRRSDDQYDARLDYNLSKNDLVFARYILGTANQFFPGSFDPFNSSQIFRGHNVVGGWTHIFSPTLINDFRIGYQKNYLRFGCEGCPRAAGTIESLGIANLTAVRPDLEEYPNVSFEHFASLGDGFPGFYPDVLPDSLMKYEDTLTKIVGRHSFTFGFDIDNWNTDGVQDPRQVNGIISFGSTFSNLGGESVDANPAADLADLELGFPSGNPAGFYTAHPIVTRLLGGRWLSLFAQDTFRVNRKLTVEAGLRWERRTQPYDKDNQIATVYPLSNDSTPGDAFMLTALPDAANDALCSNPYFTTLSGGCIIMSSALRKQRGFSSDQVHRLSLGDSNGSFAPRMGVSLSPFASGKVVIHAGGGVFFDLPVANPMGANANNNPVFTQTPTFNTVFGAPPPLTNGVPTTTANIFVNAPLQSIAHTFALLMPSPFFHMPTVYQWSLSTQTQLAKNTSLDVGYIGNKGIHLDFIHSNGNQSHPQPNTDEASIQAARPWPDLGVVGYDSYAGDSNYNALYVKVNQRLTHGLSGLVAYTYAKTLNTNQSNSDFGSIAQDDNNPLANYGVADSSIRHRLVVSGIYQMPFGKGRSFLSGAGSVVNAIAGGWDISAIITLQSGYPFTVLANDFSNTGSFSPRPDRTCSGQLDDRTIQQWFDTNCFTTSALEAASNTGAPRFGNSGRNILTGPGLVNVDTSLIKRFSIHEQWRGEFRVEAFNLFNHPNYGLPDSFLDDGFTGQISSTVGAGSTGSNRELQLGLSLRF